MLAAPMLSLLIVTLGLFCPRATSNAPGGICPDDAPQYTGYLNAGPDAEYFYYLATSRSQNPAGDPLVLWMTGGPGCSSMLAFLTENGPCRVDGHVGDDWKLAKNPWSWTEVANVVWVDQPIGVGFSSPGSSESSMVSTEKEVADRMFSFLQAFYAKFPEFMHVPLFVTGESYGGRFVPVVAARILREAHNGVGMLAGVAIGNGMVDPSLQFKSKPLMAYTGGEGGSLGGGVINASMFEKMESEIPACENSINTCEMDPTPKNCINGYATCVMSEMFPVVTSGKNPYDLRKPCEVPSNGMCYDISSETSFLNSDKIKRRLNVPQHRSWEACNMTATFPFIKSGDELMDYRSAVIELLHGGAHVLVYAGDTDFMVDWLGCKAWVEQLPWTYQSEWKAAPNIPFTVREHAKGFMQTAHGLTFLQLFDSGHMVPMDQPEAALAMLKAFISSKAFSHKSVAPIDALEQAHEPTAVPETTMATLAGECFLAALITAGLYVVVILRKRQHRHVDQDAYLLIA